MQEKRMNRFINYSKSWKWLLAVTLAAVVAGCGGGGNGGGGAVPAPGAVSPTAPGVGTGVAGQGQGPASVNLGSAGDYVILAESTITSIPASAISGNVGLSPATGAGLVLTCAEVTGTIFSVDAAGPLPCRVTDAPGLTAAIAARGIAYTDAAGRAPDYTELGAGNIGGLTLAPATYNWGTGVLVPTSVTLTGGPNDVWIFQIAQGLTVSSGVEIILAGGALPQNIYWQVAGAVELGTTSQFRGVILSQTSIAVLTGASVDGRLMAGTAVTLDQNRVTQP